MKLLIKNAFPRAERPLNFTPSVSVVICTRNRPEELERCLVALHSQKYPYFDVLVVDSAPQNTLASQLASRMGAGYEVEAKPGLSRARNRGIQASTGEIIAFLDDDAVPDVDWLGNLAVQFADEQVAVVTGRVREFKVPGERNEEVSEFFSLDSLGDQRRTIDSHTPAWFEIAGFGGAGLGSNMAFRRSATRSWPGFNPRLGSGSLINGCEEHLAFLDMIDLGHQLVYTPDAIVFHPYPRDLKSLRRSHLRRLTSQGGYAAVLLFGSAAHRRDALVYVLQALRGVRRDWRGQETPKTPDSLIPNWLRVGARLMGPLLYLRTLLERRPASTPFAVSYSTTSARASMSERKEELSSLLTS